MRTGRPRRCSITLSEGRREQLELDAAAGKLDALAVEALAYYESGQTREL